MFSQTNLAYPKSQYIFSAVTLATITKRSKLTLHLSSKQFYDPHICLIFRFTFPLQNCITPTILRSFIKENPSNSQKLCAFSSNILGAYELLCLQISSLTIFKHVPHLMLSSICYSLVNVWPDSFHTTKDSYSTPKLNCRDQMKPSVQHIQPISSPQNSNTLLALFKNIQLTFNTSCHGGHFQTLGTSLPIHKFSSNIICLSHT